MRKSFLLTFIVLVLAGCVSSGFGNPYDTRYDREAEAAPNQLTPQNALYRPQPGTVESEALPAEGIQQAGLDYLPPEQNGSREYPGTPSYGQEGNSYNNNPYMSVPPERNRQPAANGFAAVPPAGYGPKLKVALLVPLSGEDASLGQSLLQAAQLALFDLKFDNFELMPRDTKGTPEGARIAAYSAVEAGADLVLGPLFSGSVREAKPVFSRAGINMLSFSTDWSQAGGNTFIMGFLPFAQVQRITQYALDNGYANIGILAPNSDYGNAVIAAYHSYAYRTGLPTPEVMRFPVEEEIDISGIVRSFAKYDERVEALNQRVAELERTLEVNPYDAAAKKELKSLEKAETYGDLPFDAILLPVGGDQARSIASLLSLYDLTPDQVRRLGTGLWDDKGLTAEPGLKDAWYAAPSPTLRERFEAQYKDVYGQTPPRIASLAYDATALAVVLARQARPGMSSREIFAREHVMSANGFAGIDGIFRFRPDGLIERGLAVMEIDRGGAKVIDEAPRTFQRSTFSQSN